MSKSRHVDNQRGTYTAPKRIEAPNRDVNAAMRASQAVALRASKMTYDQIAQTVGYSNASICRKAIMRELDRVVVRNVDELRMQELDMLDRVHHECWQLLMDKENKGRLFAADRILAISERKSKLMGLDTPIGALNSNMVVVREVPPGYLGIATEAPKE